MLLYLIRHGERAEKGEGEDAANIPLTPKGLRQADLTGRRLVGEGIQRLYASDMTRALQTAEAVNRHLNLPLIIRPDLREIDIGECDALGWAAACKRHPEFREAFERHEIDVPYPNGESGADVFLRAGRTLTEIESSGLDRAVLVAHGGTIRCVLCGALGIPQHRRFFFGNPPANCGITVLQWEGGKYFLHSFNDCAHLFGCR